MLSLCVLIFLINFVFIQRCKEYFEQRLADYHSDTLTTDKELLMKIDKLEPKTVSTFETINYNKFKNLISLFSCMGKILYSPCHAFLTLVCSTCLTKAIMKSSDIPV